MDKVFQEIDFYLLLIGFIATIFSLPILGAGCSILCGYYAFRNKHKTIFASTLGVGALALFIWITSLIGA